MDFRAREVRDDERALIGRVWRRRRREKANQSLLVRGNGGRLLLGGLHVPQLVDPILFGARVVDQQLQEHPLVLGLVPLR
jgi:hypothetical protein